MLTLDGFLLARIAEDEHWACSASALNGPVWTASNGFINGTADTNANPRAYNGDTELWDDEGALSMHSDTAAFIAANDPRRVLTECEAKRLIVRYHGSRMLGACQEDGGLFPCRTLRALALPYADHPDYCEEWRP